jgi:WD40 repeat protein
MGFGSTYRKTFPKIFFCLVLCLFPAIHSHAQDRRPVSAEPIRTVFQTGHTTWTQGIRFRNDGKLFASLDETGAIKVWRSSDGRLLSTWAVDLSLHGNNYIWDRFWFDNNQNLVFCSLNNGKLRTTTYNPFSGKLLDTSTTPLPNRDFEEMSNDGRMILLRADSPAGQPATLELRQTSDMGVIALLTIPEGNPHSVKLSPSGQYLAASTKDPDMDSKPGKIHIWRTTDQQAFGPFPINDELLGVSDQGIAVTGIEGKIVLRKIGDWSVAREFEIPTLPNFAAFSPDGRHLIVMSRYDLIWRLWNLENNDIALESESFAEISEFVPAAVFSPDNSFIALKGPGMQGSAGYLYSPALGLWKLADYKGGPITDAGRRITDPRISMAGDLLLAMEELDGTRNEERSRANLWDLRNGTLLWSWSAGGECQASALSPDGEFMAALSPEMDLFVWRVPDLTLIHQYSLKDAGFDKWVQGLALGPGGKIAAVPGVDVTEILVIDLAKGRVKARLFDQNREFLNKIVISPNGRYLAEDSSHPSTNNQDVTNSATVWDIIEKRKIAAVDMEPYALLGFSRDEKYLLADTMVYELPKGRKTADMRDLEQAGRQSDFSFWGYGYTKSLAGKGGVLAETIGGGEGIRIKDAVTGEIRALLFNIKGGYLVQTPEGFFSGTGDFNQYVHYARGEQVYEFNQFYDVFYRPDLVQKKLRGEDISLLSRGLNIRAALENPPPSVTIVTPDTVSQSKTRRITVRLKVQDTGGGIGDIRLFHNGKLAHSRGVYRVARQTPETGNNTSPEYDVYQTARRSVVLVEASTRPETRRLEWSDVDSLNRDTEKTYELDLVKGTNTIAAAAFNGPNTVMSAIRSVTVEADVPDRPPRLFALVAGINKYKGAPDLEYAVKDAHDMTALIKKTGPKLFKHVRLTLLENPTKDEILTAMEKTASETAPEDVFLFYSASHGVADDDLYYLICSDYAGGHPSSNGSISSMELMEYSKRVPALKNVFILDTCQSGSVGAIVSGLYDARIAVLAKSLGMHIMAGAKSGQGAIDNYKGNGLFTHFVLQALLGQADANQDGWINVFEMTPYLQTKVTEASQGSQSAFIRNFGDDFPIVRLR